jgi:ankyrin repeat protein
MACYTCFPIQNFAQILRPRIVEAHPNSFLKGNMSDSEDRSGSELGHLPVEPDTVEDLFKALEGEGVSELQELSAEFWTRNKGKLDTLHNGRRALSLAAQKGNLRVVETLLDYGADVNVKDDGGQTALLLVAQKR